MTISLAETPSLVTLVWAAAGSWVSARALTARPNALNDFDIAISSLLARVERRVGPSQSFAVFKIPLSMSATGSSHRPLAIHGVDLDGITLVHETALQLHGRRQFLVLRRELTFDQIELLDGFDAREVDVDRLDLAMDQVLDLGRAAKAGVIGKGNVVVLGVFFDILLIDHEQTRQIRPLVADHHRVRDVRRELQLVLDFRRRDVLAARRDDDVLHPVGDLDEAFIVDDPDIARVEPAVDDRLRRLLRVVEVAEEDGGPAHQNLHLRREADLDA